MKDKASTYAVGEICGEEAGSGWGVELALGRSAS